MIWIALAAGVLGWADVPVKVSDYAGLRRALANAKPGTTILLEPGDYAGGFQIEGVTGTAKEPIVVGGRDPKHPPRIVGGGLHFVSVAHLEIRDLLVMGPGGNGVNTDDGGVREKPAHHVTYRRITVTDYTGRGDVGLKMAGVDDFQIVDCDVRAYDTCGVDFVGCHRGVVEDCRFERGVGVGVQAKGASANVVVRACRVKDYGARGVNLGGSTGIPYFRPPLERTPAGDRYEAKDVEVVGCTFEGGDAPIAFAGADGGNVHHNTIYVPSKWAVRILQETATPDFVPSRNGVFAHNLVVFRSDRWLEGGVNVGPNTAPKTFTFADNVWYCFDAPKKSQPTLPTPERGGVAGRDPLLVDPAKGDFGVRSGSPAKSAGAHAAGTATK